MAETPVPGAAALNVETLLLEKEQLQKKVDELTQKLADVTAPRYMQEAAEAFAFQKLCQHLQQRLDAQNIDMMILAGFCRNCLCKWYHVGAATFGLGLTYEQSCENEMVRTGHSSRVHERTQTRSAAFQIETIASAPPTAKCVPLGSNSMQ